MEYEHLAWLALLAATWVAVIVGMYLVVGRKHDAALLARKEREAEGAVVLGKLHTRRLLHPSDREPHEVSAVMDLRPDGSGGFVEFVPVRVKGVKGAVAVRPLRQDSRGRVDGDGDDRRTERARKRRERRRQRAKSR